VIEIKFKPSTDGLIKALQGLEKDLQEKALRSGIVAAIKPVKASMKALAPRGSTGGLQGSIGHVGLSKTAAGRIGASGLAILVGQVKKSGGISQYGKAVWHDLGTKSGEKFSHPTKATHFIDEGFKKEEPGFDSRFYSGLTKYLKKVGFA
jgi:hypothetical protein